MHVKGNYTLYLKKNHTKVIYKPTVYSNQLHVQLCCTTTAYHWTIRKLWIVASVYQFDKIPQEVIKNSHKSLTISVLFTLTVCHHLLQMVQATQTEPL